MGVAAVVGFGARVGAFLSEAPPSQMGYQEQSLFPSRSPLNGSVEHTQILSRRGRRGTPRRAGAEGCPRGALGGGGCPCGGPWTPGRVERRRAAWWGDGRSRGRACGRSGCRTGRLACCVACARGALVWAGSRWCLCVAWGQGSEGAGFWGKGLVSGWGKVEVELTR